MKADDFTDIETYISELRTRLGEHGWRIELDTSDPWACVTLNHDLTTPISFSFPNEKESLEQMMIEGLKSPEFAIIAKAPSAIEHASLMKAVREAATVHSWDSQVIAVIARILQAHGVITNDEAHWLENAGHPWRT